ncbi:MAG: hypothetical protein ACJ8G5_20535, partial [Burkholderiales bacterium]
MKYKVAQPHRSPSHGFDRRRFLGALGSGLGLGSSGLLGVEEALAQSFVLREENFGRMFPQLPAFFGDRPPRGLGTVLLEIGKRGGVMDAGDRLAASSSGSDQAQAAINLIADPALS